MLRIISLFLLLIISRVCFAVTVPATATHSAPLYYLVGVDFSPFPDYSVLCSNYVESLVSMGRSRGFISVSETACKYYTSAWNEYSHPIGTTMSSSYSCPAGYNLSDSAGNADSSGQYCTKNSCQDLYQTSTMIPIPVGQSVTNACFDGCSASLFEGGSWVCPADSVVPCSVRVSFDGNSCSGGVDYAANASSSDFDSPSPPCSGGSTSGTVNGETVTTCADDGTDSAPPVTDAPSGSTSTDTSGLGPSVGDPENTSGSQTGTQTGSYGDTSSSSGGSSGSSSGGASGTDSGGTSGTDSGGTSGADSGGTSGTDSGGTSGTDSGGTSGTDSGGTSGTDSGGTSGTDSGGTSGTDSGGTSGADSGGTSGADSGGTSGTDSGGTSGTDSGGTSGSGGGTDSGTGTATSGAGGTDSPAPAPEPEEEEESGDGGGTFAAPGEGTDYLKDVFGESDLASLATDNAELTTKINQKMADVKGIFNLGTLSVSGDMPENQQEIKGASVDLSGRNIFEQLSIVAAAFYLCAIATAIYIVMGGRK